MLGKIEGESRSGQLKMRWLDSTTDSMDMNLSKLQETAWRGVWCGEGEPGVLQSVTSRRVGHDLANEQQVEPGLLQSMGLQRAGHDLLTEQQQKYILELR